MPESTLSRIAEFIHGTVGSDSLPSDVASRNRKAIADTIAVSIAATGEENLVNLAAIARSGSGPFRDLLDEAGSLEDAAFVNGLLAHGLDFDDTHFPSVLHPSSVVVPVVLAYATTTEVTNSQLVSAIAAGREVAIRLGLAGYDQARRLSTYMERGFHATALCGGIAAAGTLAALYGGDPDEVGSAMSIASSMVGGLIEGNRSGGMVKPFHNAWAAATAAVAARLAVNGLVGSTSALDGPYGFMESHAGPVARDGTWLEGIGSAWRSDQVYTKSYPINHFLHAAVDAALAAHHQLSPQELMGIESVVVGLPEQVIGVVGEPRERKIDPRSGYEAKFSAHYTVAAALTSGHPLTLEDFGEDWPRSVAGGELIHRVEAVADARATELFPNTLSARLTLRGRRTGKGGVSIWVDAVAGGPDNPLTPMQEAAKLEDCLLHAHRPAESVVPGVLGTLTGRNGSATKSLRALLAEEPVG